MKLTVTASNRDRLQIGSDATNLFIRSLQWQTFQDFELLIADGGSKNYEETKEYLENYDGPVPMRMVQHKIGDAFLRSLLNNVGIRNAKAEYIMTTDVDMAFGPKFLQTLNELLSTKIFIDSRTMYWKLPFAKMIYGGKKDLYNKVEECRIGRIKKRTTAGGCQCTHIDNWRRVRGFDENYIGWGSEDQDLLQRIKMSGIKIQWLGESNETIMLFHQPHVRENLKQDLAYQHKNKKLLNKIKEYVVNPNGWGGKD